MKKQEKDNQEEIFENNVDTEAPKQEPVAPAKPNTYIHVDTFLQTAVPLFGLNRMQARGFKTMMFGRQYQHTLEDFVVELEKYLGKKLR